MNIKIDIIVYKIIITPLGDTCGKFIIKYILKINGNESEESFHGDYSNQSLLEIKDSLWNGYAFNLIIKDIRI